MCYSHRASQCGSDRAQQFQEKFRSFGFGPRAAHFARHQASVPVNIREQKDWYELFLFAPGLNKDAFQVNVADEILTIRFDRQPDQERSQWLYQEYPSGPFERRFALHGKIDTNSITARYTDGVLELTLPKLPGSEGHEVPIA
jgi:HSP20 family protein